MAAPWSKIFLFCLGLCFILFPQNKAQTYSIQFDQISDCTGTQYFNLAELQCKDCAEFQRQTADGLSCECQPGYQLIEDRGGPNIMCRACPAGQTTTVDGWNCIQCTTGLSPTNECVACDEDNAIGVEYTIDGQLENQKNCKMCLDTTQPDSVGTRCIRCDQSVAGTCICAPPLIQKGGLCLPAELVKPVGEVSFNVPFVSLPDQPSSLRSWFFAQYLQGAEAMCSQYQNFTSCQMLGNMCVMLDYSREFDPGVSACYHYIRTQVELGEFGEITGWPTSMPWLYYDPDEDTEDVLAETTITTQFSAKPSSENSKLKMFVGTYTGNGTYLGLQSTNGGTINLCKDTVKKMDAAWTFATTYESTCNINAQDFWNNYETIFYDMYLQWGETPETQELFAIPVLNENFKEDNNYVNRKGRVNDWQLTRRFFLVDNLSGKISIDTPAKVVRYASSIDLEINIQQGEGEARVGKIYPPMLRIRYEEIYYDEEYEINKPKKVSFRVRYFMRRGGSNKKLSITLGVLSAFAMIFALIKSNGWRRRAGLIYIDITTMIKYLVIVLGYISDVFFVTILGTSLYWLLFFKRQDQVYLVLPTEGQEEKFIIYMSCAFVFKCIDLMHLLFSQITSDIFLIDWERSRGRVVQSSDVSNSKGTMAPISIWRTYFIANEWNEIQDTRRINSVFQMLTVLFFLEVIGLKDLSTTDPRSEVYPSEDEYRGVQSRVLRFGIAAGMYLLIALFQWLFFALIYERFVEDSLRNFVDLCSMANVSVFVLAHKNYGFYIHGRSVHGFADTDMKEMRGQMKREEDNLCGQRGLLPNSDQQTFEMLLPIKFREQYDKIYQPLQGAVARIEGQRGRPTAGGDTSTDRYNQAYTTMNKFLCTFIDHGMRDIDYMVKDKLLFEQILDMEFYDPAEKGFFYNDGGHAFEKVLFHGQETTLIMFEILLFCIVDLIFTNYVLAGFITYLAGLFIRKFRSAAGRNNLAKKTLVDERFLI